MFKINRTSLFSAFAVAALAGSVVVADEKADMKMDLSKAVMQQTDKMKEMAAEPAQMAMMKDEMAKMMVMDHMAMKIAMDPQCKETIMKAMQDENVKKTHEAAMAMAKDPEQSKKLMDEVMADPMAMKSVMHSAMMMSMMKDKMGEQMKGMGGKMMDHNDMK